MTSSTLLDFAYDVPHVVDIDLGGDGSIDRQCTFLPSAGSFPQAPPLAHIVFDETLDTLLTYVPADFGKLAALPIPTPCMPGGG